MILEPPDEVRPGRGIPRESGDDPARTMPPMAAAMYSPRERG